MRIRPLVLLSLVVTLVALLVAGCNRDTAPPTSEAVDQTTEQVADAGTPDPVAPATETQTPADMPAEAEEPVEAEASVEAEAPVEADVIAIVNGIPVSYADFERSKQQVISRYQQIYAQFRQDVRALLVGPDGRLFELRIEDEALELATTRAMVAHELKQHDAMVPAGDVDAEFERQYTEFLVLLGMSDQEFQQAFERGELVGFQTGDLTFDQFISIAKLTVREELEIEAIQRLLAGPMEYSEEELIAFFEARRVDYNIEEQVEASHILVETEELAQQLLDELAAGADFATLAQTHSIDTGSGARGGELAWFGRGRMVAPFEEAAFNTPVGELSSIVQTQFGYHIIWVTDHQPEVRPQFEDVIDQVTSDLEAEIMAQKFNEWHTNTRPLADIVVKYLMLDAFRTKQVDIDQGLQAFVRIRDEELADDPYLDYIIASIYETKFDQAQQAKRDLEGSETLTPSQQEQIDMLTADIETYRTQALAFYHAALSQLGSGVGIEARIQVLDPAPEVVPPSE